MNNKIITLARIADAFGWDLGSYTDPDDLDRSTGYFLQDPKLDEEDGRLEFDTLEEIATHIHDLIIDMDLYDLENALTVPDDFHHCLDGLCLVWHFWNIIAETKEIGDDISDQIEELAIQGINDTLLQMLEQMTDGGQEGDTDEG